MIGPFVLNLIILRMPLLGRRNVTHYPDMLYYVARKTDDNNKGKDLAVHAMLPFY